MIFNKYINKYYLKYSPLLILGIAALVAVDFFQLKIPEFYRMVINGMNGIDVEVKGQMVAFTKEVLLNDICLPLIVVIVIMVIGRFLWRVCFYGSAIKVEHDLRCRMFDHSRFLSQSYYQENKVGSLMSLYTNDLDTINECFGDGMLMLFDALLLGGMALLKMWKMDHLLTLLSLIPLAILLVLSFLISTALTKRWDERQEAFSVLSDFSQEKIMGIAVIKAFVKEVHEIKEYAKLNKIHEDKNVDFTKISTLLDVIIQLLAETVVGVILGYGGFLVYKGTFDAGRLVEYIGYFSSIVWPVLAISFLIEMRSRGKASINRISELLDSEIDVKDREGAEELSEVKGEIEFRNLTFSFPGKDYPNLKNVSFKINAGESVGIVGRTGCGKTTIVDLILRTYNVPDGTLFIDGKDVNDVTIHSVREGCAYVPQDNFLFSTKVAGNIEFAVDNATREQVEEAAKMSGVYDDIVEFTDGFDTMMGERGVTVSGGQKQRISIARALLKDAPILILDDSVSAVDTATEQTILKNLKESRKGKTTILIAHRISTIEQMDKILFVEDGTVIASGSHDELVKTCPEYHKMVELQQLEKEEGGEDDE